MKILKIFFYAIFSALRWLFFWEWDLITKTGAELAEGEEKSEFLSSANTGVLLDGDNLRLSRSSSHQHILMVANSGAGKTATLIKPNAFDKASQDCSMVFNDPKGEILAATHQHMKQQGFKIIIINPERLGVSSYFNPLLEAESDIELEQLAEILVGGKKESADQFWSNGSLRFVSLFLKCLRNAGKENPRYNTLTNLYFLFQNFGEDGAALGKWMAQYTINPDDPTDQSLIMEWKGVLTGNIEGIKSFILNAQTDLKALASSNIARLTSVSDIDLASIRKQKTVIYFVTPPQHAEHYAFLISIFFRSVFNMCMKTEPRPEDLDVYVFYDEFGHSTIPNFATTATTIRSYRVSLCIVLQGLSQLDMRYGKDAAFSIRSGFSTYLTLSGSDEETCAFFEKKCGKVRERQRANHKSQELENLIEYNLMNADEIRRIRKSQALIVSTNRQAVLVNTKFIGKAGDRGNNPRFSALISKKPYQGGQDFTKRNRLLYLDLGEVENGA